MFDTDAVKFRYHSASTCCNVETRIAGSPLWATTPYLEDKVPAFFVGTKGSGVGVGVGGTIVAVGYAVGTGDPAGVSVDVGTGVGVETGVGVGTGVGITVGSKVGTGVAIDGVAVGVGVDAGISVGVGTGVTVGSADGAGTRVDVGDGWSTAVAVAGITVGVPFGLVQGAGSLRLAYRRSALPWGLDQLLTQWQVPLQLWQSSRCRQLKSQPDKQSTESLAPE